MSKKKKKKQRRNNVAIQSQLQPKPKTETSTVFNFCNTCRGICWNEKDNIATQVAAYKMFGIIPNKCVNSSTGQQLCPYA